MFVLMATQPYSLLLGPLLIGPYRLVLILLSIPLILGWLRGKYGGILFIDFLLPAHVLWMCISLLANGDASRVFEYGVSQVFDIFVAYLLGRAAIRTKEDFYFFTKLFLALLLFLLPFAVIESTQGKMILQNLFRGLPSIKVFNPITINYPERMGMMRAQTTINHPIVYGVFCSIGVSFGLVGMRYYKGGTSFFKRALFTLGAMGGTFFSLSAGALASMALQLALFAWNVLMAASAERWKIIGALFLAVYVFLDIVAERPPLLVMARWVAFSGSTAWNRYLIWIYGTAEVGRHPLFGMGLFYDWIRAPWMSSSIDNHWLLIAMRFGIPAVVLLLWGYFTILVKLIRLNLAADPELCAIRFSFVFTFIALFVSLGTVVSWHIQYSLIMMLLGGSVWLFNEPASKEIVARSVRESLPSRLRPPDPDAAGDEADPASAEGMAAPASRYTRFPAGPRRRRPPEGR